MNQEINSDAKVSLATWNQYVYGNDAESGNLIDRAAKVYQGNHPGLPYCEAVRAVGRGAEEAGEEADREIGRRSEAYMGHFKIKTYGQARERVLSHDPKLAADVGEAKGLVRAGEEVDKRARQYSREHRVSYSEAMQEVLGDDPGLAAAYQSKPDEFYVAASHDYEDENALEKQPALNRVGSILAGAKMEDHSIDVDLAIRLARQLDRILIMRAATEALMRIAEQIANDDTESKFRGDALNKAFPVALREAPGLAEAYNNGILTERGLVEMFPQWFKD